MKNKIHQLITLLILLLVMSLQAQEKERDVSEQKKDSLSAAFYDDIIKGELKIIDEKHEQYASEQRLILKEKVEWINLSLEKGELTVIQADELKNSWAEKIAKKINAHRIKTDAEMEFHKLNGIQGLHTSKVEISTKDGIKLDIKQSEREKQKYIRTYTSFSLSFGYNFMNGDDLGINDFSYPNNNYFAIGYKWKTTLDKDTNHFRLLYGVEYQSNGTELNGNRYITQGNQSIIAPLTSLVPDGATVNKAKFRQDQIVFPFHLEIGGAERKDYDDGRVRFNTEDKWYVGLGGFAGFNTSSRLKLKYDLDGTEIKEIRVNNFDNEKFIYGLDAYVGWGNYSIFGRMNLNNVFKSGSVDAQYISFGIRLQ